MHLKTVKVTNPGNVLVQIPRFVVSQWHTKSGDILEMFYNEDTNTITIGQAVQPRSRTTRED